MHKDRFDMIEDMTYINCAYMGPMLKSSVEISKSMMEKNFLMMMIFLIEL